ncbi:MAG: formylglycine-generating enzyme family protein [Spirochaetes bacterium]|nr:formylglycine-generating enzyme family protein [Spirochaetota bacterium]
MNGSLRHDIALTHYSSLILILTSFLFYTAILSCGSAAPRNDAPITRKTVGGMEFAKIPGGGFLMGFSDCGQGVAEECPRHRVGVSPFWMGACEVTREEYLAVMGADPSRGGPGARLPVTRVSWNDAAEFCRRFGARHGVRARLPYEAEWEYACRAGTSTHYYWGDRVDGRYCWYYHNSGASGGGGGPRPVGGRRANAFGLFDMSGNVWEWCADRYDIRYYASSPENNPRGPSRGELRVLRGGSWKDGGYYMRSGLRNAGGPDIGDGFRGFRVVLEAE